MRTAYVSRTEATLTLCLSDRPILLRTSSLVVNQVVLAARCSYFRGMFESGMRDAGSQRATLDDIPYPVFMALLEYLYTDSAEVPSNLALPLFAAADFLGVEHLKSLCVARIEAELSIENVCSALTVADKHLAANLKATCIAFIVEHFQAVLNTQSFKTLARDLLDLVHLGVAERLEGLTIAASPPRGGHAR